MISGSLRRFPLFASLSDDDVALLERVFVEDTVASGHVFVREGDRATASTAAMFVLLDGTVAVSAAAPDGGFGVQRRLGPGQIFGAVALVADVTRTATCTAEGRVTFARLDRLSFNELYRQDVGLYARFQMVIAQSLAADLRALREMLVATLATGDVAALVGRYGGHAAEK